MSAGEPGAELEDRARGCLLGLAAGNLLGLPNESAAEARKDLLRDIDPRELVRPFDDDLAQAFELGASLVEHAGVDGRDLGRRFLHWAATNGRGMGGQTRAVLALLDQGLLPHAAARVVWERSGRQAAGNGGVMRVAPVGLYYAGAEPAVLARAAEETTAVTHCDPRCTQSAIAVAAGVAAALRGDSPRAAALRALQSLEQPEPELVELLGALGTLELEDLPLRGPHQGYTVTCAAVGLWAAVQPGPLEPVLLAVTNAGGDADTNGAVAGALLGARHGERALPERWLARIPQRAELARLAERLLREGAARTGSRAAERPALP